MKTEKIIRISLKIFWSMVCVLAIFALMNYPGRTIVYLTFTVVLNALFICGFTKGKIYFDTFIGIFFWLGFWVKYSLRIAFLGGQFQAVELVGKFLGMPVEHDFSLLVASCGIGGLLVASYIRRKFLFSYVNLAGKARLESIFVFYQRYRKSILIVFSSLFVTIAITNVVFGIYQRGSLPKTILPFGFSGVYTWLLLFGLTSVSAVILDCEFRLKNNPYLASLMSILEISFSNISMLSRGMILNGGSLLIGLHDTAKKRYYHPGLRYKLLMLIVFVTLFIGSVLVTNQVRAQLFYSDFPTRTNISKSIVARTVLKGLSSRVSSAISSMFSINISIPPIPEPVIEAISGIETLFIDRWLGIEGVMSVVSHQDLGWDFWKEAWREKYTHSGTSMYDLVVLGASLEGLKSHHFISMPGIVAFFYYPGSILFLFFSMLVLGLLAAGIEMFVYKLCGANIILCALIGQVVAYRYAHFGYVPSQSYLLFGSIFLNVLMIVFFDRFLLYRNNRLTASSPE